MTTKLIKYNDSYKSEFDNLMSNEAHIKCNDIIVTSDDPIYNIFVVIKSGDLIGVCYIYEQSDNIYIGYIFDEEPDDIEFKDIFILFRRSIMGEYPSVHYAHYFVSDEYADCKLLSLPYVTKTAITDADLGGAVYKLGLKFTYYINSSSFSNKIYRPYFTIRSVWREVELDKNNKYADFILVEGHGIYDKKDYDKISYLKNIIGIGKEIITEKDNLYKAFKNETWERETKNNVIYRSLKRTKAVPNDYLIKTYYINVTHDDHINPEVFKDNVWILKPVGGYSGKGIEIHDTHDKYIKFLNKKNHKYEKWVMQKYIKNPLLFRGYKFHLRAYFLYIPFLKKSYVLSDIELIRAKKKYIDSNYNDHDIHQTHRLKGIFLFLRDFGKEYGNDKMRIIHDRIRDVMYGISSMIKKMQISCYNESLRCYEFFAADIMVTDKYEVKLLEINDKVGTGYPDSPDEIEPFFAKIYEDLFVLAIDNVFPPLDQSVRVKKLYSGDYTRLLRISTDMNVMRYIGNGKIWSEEKIKKIFEYQKIEDEKDVRDVEYFQYSIYHADSMIGYIQLAKTWKKRNDNRYFITVFIDRRYHGRGLTIKALNIFYKKMNKARPDIKDIYFAVHPKNIKMKAFMEKNEMNVIDTKDINGVKYSIYKNIDL
jgi:RimJ/RimL family protein N-acetyltransferase